MKISRKSFISYIKRLQDYEKREENLSKALSEYCEDLWFFQPKDIVSLVIDLLITLTGDNKEDSIIKYWIYELDYGRKWVEGTITDVDGVDIKLQNPEDLYKYLILYNEQEG